MAFTFLMLLAGSAFFALVFKQKIEITMPFWILSIIVFLYFFGLFGVAHIGTYIILIFSCISLIYSVVLIVRNNNELSRVITPGLFIFLLLFLLAWWSTRNRMFTISDEFSHWGLAVKNIYYLNGFSGVADSFIVFKEYPPSLALFEYLFTFLTGSFSEGTIYHGFLVIYFALVLPICINIKWNQIGKMLLNISIILVLPLLQFWDFYIDIYADAMVGLFLAYVLVSYFFFERKPFFLINIGLAAFVLVLTKPAAFGVSIIAFLIIFADFIIEKNKRNLSAVISVLGGILGAKVSWIAYLNITIGPASTYLSKQAMPVIDIPKLNAIIGNFVIYSVGKNKTIPEGAYTRIPFTTLGFIAVMMLLGIIVIRFILDEKTQKRYRNYLVYIFIGWIFYTISIIAVYYLYFPAESAIRLDSIGRYMQTYMFGILLFIIMSWLLTEQKGQLAGKYLKSTILIISMLAFNGLGGLADFTILSPMRSKETIQTRSLYDYYKTQTQSISNCNMYFVNIDKTRFLYLVCNYTSAENLITLYEVNAGDSGFEFEQNSNWHDLNMQVMTAVEWSSSLYESFDYVYIFRTNDEFNQEYAGLFVGGVESMTNDTLYRVNKSEGSVSLEAIAGGSEQ